MLMTYDHLNSDELRGTTQADYLVALDADFRMEENNGVLIYRESAFPVVEFARHLLIWLNDPNRGDFEFNSMSFEEPASVALRHTKSGWTFTSIFAPGRSSVPVGWTEVERCSRAFVSRVERDLVALGLEPGALLRN
ncbi:MAG TPA: hypothetical protein VM677_34865 [Actinokineospora sp.]|jgi:hypothetical protein|nr:hypothetical protein [Actinokineospora sp.]